MSTDDLTHLESIREEEVHGVIPMLPAGVRILDFGAGLGFQARRFKQLGFDVVAVDVAPVENMHYVFPVLFYDGSTLPYPDGHFDVVFSSNVLEHVVDLDATLKELTRVLRNGGTMLHVLPSASWRWWTTLAEFAAVPRKLIRCVRLPASELRLGQLLPRWLAVFAELLGQLVRPLLFIRHGEEGNAITELFRFSRRSWLPTFERLGYEVKLVQPSGLYYTGEILLGSRLPISIRRSLARWLGSSTVVWRVVPRVVVLEPG